MKLKFQVPVVLFCSLLIGSCTQGTQDAKVTDSDSTKSVNDTAVSLVDSNTNDIYSNYIELKNALVASDAEKAKTAAADLSLVLQNVDGCENTAQVAATISESSDLEVQRAEFTVLSADLVALMKHTNISSGNIYVQYCPMANDNEGGYWLASESSINNPYYGSEMLKCGEVKETLAAK